jgi:hypothetical protein
MGFEEVWTAPHSPWQTAYVERFIGSVRRECLDHVRLELPILAPNPGPGNVARRPISALR